MAQTLSPAPKAFMIAAAKSGAGKTTARPSDGQLFACGGRAAKSLILRRNTSLAISLGRSGLVEHLSARCLPFHHDF
jgi:hypothetical protein